MWALGDYPAVASEIIADARRGPGRDRRHHSRPARPRRRRRLRQRGAARRPPRRRRRRHRPHARAARGRAPGRRGRGTRADWETADAEALPYDDGSFDAVISCVGVMFAPHHQAAADELVRVTRPGGTIGLLSWTPEGFIGQMFATMKPYAPPPPPGAQPPPLWGRADHVRELLGDRVTDLDARQQTLRGGPLRRRCRVPRLLQGQLRPHDRGLQGDRRLDPSGWPPSTRSWPRWATASTGDGAMDWEYLLVTARRA